MINLSCEEKTFETQLSSKMEFHNSIEEIELSLAIDPQTDLTLEF